MAQIFAECVNGVLTLIDEQIARVGKAEWRVKVILPHIDHSAKVADEKPERNPCGRLWSLALPAADAPEKS